MDTRTLPLDDPHSPSTECRKCRGTGKLLGWDFATNTEAEVACWKCKGAGRVLARAVQKAAPPRPRSPYPNTGAPKVIDPTIPGDGPYILHKALKLLPEAEQTYFVGAHFEDGTDEWWNNRMEKSQATALCAALNWWYATNRSLVGVRAPADPETP